MVELRGVASTDLSRTEQAALRRLLDQAFGARFDDGD
jgi:hypothetical protein